MDRSEATVEDVAPEVARPRATHLRVAPPAKRSRLAAARAALGRLMPVLRVLGFVGALAVVIYMGVRAGREVELSQLAWAPLPFAVLASGLWWVLLARGWALLLTGRSQRADVSVWCRTQALRFLPGGFWAPASRVAIVHGGWADRIATVAAENLIALAAAMTIGGVALGLAESPLWLALAPAVAGPLVAAKLLGDRTRVTPARTLTATWNYLAAFAAYVVAAVLVQDSVSGLEEPLAVVGAAAIAWGAGLVVVIAPGGVGVREAVYVALLAGVLPEAELLAGALTLRVVTIVAEIIVLLVAGRPTSQPAAGAQPPGPAPR